MKKILCIILAFLTMAFSVSVGVFAESALNSEDDFYEYYTNTYASQAERLKKMTLVYENDSFAMYLDDKTGETDENGFPVQSSGEFAILNKKTGEYTFSNPYDLNVDSSLKTNISKNVFLSQLLILYRDKSYSSELYISSFGSASADGQLSFKRLANGIRVEYAIGTIESKRLIPVWIEESRFEEKILDVLAESEDRMTEKERTTYYYMLEDGIYYEYCNQTSELVAQTQINIWREAYPCLEKDHTMNIYALKSGTPERVKMDIEKLIRKYCTSYTYDDLEYDHNLTEYFEDDKELELFRVALEYTFDDEGFTASVPAKSVRYNSTYYELEEIVILPYFGCVSLKDVGNVTQTGGYMFIPDGSGTLLEFYDKDGSVKRDRQSTGIMYGQDNVMETLTLSPNVENAKVPVFGLVNYYNVENRTERENLPSKIDVVSYKRGFVGIITEGETFAEITAEIGTTMWNPISNENETDYGTVYAAFTTTQSDKVSAGGVYGDDEGITKTLDTRYTGNYSIKYMFLSDPNVAEAAGAEYYEPSYVGMANAYRNYLIETGQISKLTSDQTENGVPLYIESFGSIKAKSTFMTFPIDVTTPLTTFDDVKTMMQYFGFYGIKNQRFILTGFGNGTMSETYYPTYVSWESKLGGRGGFESLLEYSERNGYTLFPQYDFLNVQRYKGGFSMMKYAARTMSGKYATLRLYDYVMQSTAYMGVSNIVSAKALEEIYSKFSKQYNKYCVSALAMKTVGYQLNSDFYVEDPITREDSKEYITDFLTSVRKDNERLLVSGGNSYTLKYATDIIELPLDNSGYSISSNSVPFLGIVLHGYKNYAGNAFNMDGDSNYALLKALENGAGLYYILSYQNTDLVKTSKISEYYSMTFDTLAPSVVEKYLTLSSAIGDLADATITAHTFPTAYRMDGGTAAVMFGLTDKFEEELASATAEYDRATAAVDDLVSRGYDTKSAIDAEDAATRAYNAARAQSALSSKFVKRYATDNVVCVTYTAPSGYSKTFYINYNTYDVAVEENEKIFIVGAESFVEIGDVEYIENVVKNYETAEAYKPRTTRERTTFQTYYEELLGAKASGNQTLVAARINTINNTINQMTKINSGVVISKTSSGKTVIVNYTSDNIIVKLSDESYVEISSQSYVLTDN